MTAASAVITSQVRDYDTVLEPYRPGADPDVDLARQRRPALYRSPVSADYCSQPAMTAGMAFALTAGNGHTLPGCTP